MFSTKFIAAAAASFSLIKSSMAVYDPSSQRNLAMYWGSGSGQYNLTYYCDQPNVDIIPIGFINIFPPQGNGLVGETFGNQCYADPIYTGPGYNGVNTPNNNHLYQQCPLLQESLYYCQQNTNKKILLSLGGESGNYALNGVADGVYLANFLWGAYGPYNASWTGVRPLDRGYFNTDKSMTIDFDGFDFDIEHSSPDQQIGYIACITRLRQLFAEHKSVNPCSKDYIISGAPQCPLDEPYMSTAIANAKFDVLWIQFYNNGGNGCTARNYIDSKATGAKSGFNYDAWVTKINGGKSAGAKLYIGLLAGQAGSVGSPNDYITADNINTLVSEYHTHPQFGGVMLYEATVAENNGQFYNQVKKVLNKVADAGTVTSSASVCKSSTSSMSSSTSTKITSTSSTSTTATSTSVSSTSSTVSSTSSKPTTSSTSSTSSSATSSSSSSSSVVSSTSSSSSSSSMISSSTSVPVSSTSSVVSTPPTSTPTPTIVPSVGACSYVGCYSEATSVRALSAQTYANTTLMSVEICAAFCKGYAYFGVEYGQECYCGDSLNDGSVIEPAGDCSFPCVGTPTELCGAGDRLNVYQCGSVSTSSSSVISSTSSTSTIPTSTSTSLTSSSSVDSSTSSTVSSTDSSSSVVSTTSSSSSSSSTDVSTTSSSMTSSSADVTSTSSSSSSSSTDVSATSSSMTSSSADVTSTSSSSSSSSTDVSTTSSSMTSSSADVTSTSSSSSSSSTDVSATSSATSSSSTDVSTTSTSSSSSSTDITSSSSSSVVSTTSASSSDSSASVPTSSSSVVSSSSSSVVPTSSTYSSSSSSATATSASTSTSKSVCTRKTSLTSSSTVVSNTASITSTGVSGSASFTSSTTSSASTSSDTGVASSSSSSSSSSESATISGTVSSSISSSATSSGSSVVSSPSSTSYTTSTVYTTSVYTVTSCAPTVTNCPVGSVTTDTIIDYTTVCPVTATETGNGKPTTTPASATTSPAVTSYSTSTVYKTTTYTITSCPATVTDCPSRMGSVTTEVVIDYTTVCPVTATETASVSLPGNGGKVISSATPATTSGSGKTTTTISSTATSYVTIKYVSSTSSAVGVATPSPSSVEIVYQISSVEVKPYATPSTLAPVSKIVGTGTGVPVVKGVETTTYMGVPTSAPSPTGSSFTGGASSVKGSWVVGLLAVVGMMMI